MEPGVGFEPTTYSLQNYCSGQLSYPGTTSLKLRKRELVIYIFLIRDIYCPFEALAQEGYPGTTSLKPENNILTKNNKDGKIDNF